jgi:hypothetical protein
MIHFAQIFVNDKLLIDDIIFYRNKERYYIVVVYFV